MTHDDSPFQSPQPEATEDRPLFVEQPYVLLLIAAVVFHVVTYGLIWAASLMGGDLVVDTNPDPAQWIGSTFQVLLGTLIVLTPLSFLLGIVSVYLVARKWDDRKRAATTAVLAAIPVFMLVVATYVLLRASRTMEDSA